jgi:hypothetical protein
LRGFSTARNALRAAGCDFCSFPPGCRMICWLHRCVARSWTVHRLAFSSSGFRCLSNQPMMWRIFDI